MKKVYLLIIFTLLISSNILSCKNVKNENITIGSENENVAIDSNNKDTLQASYNSTEVANIIFKIPEIVALNTSIRNATDGKRGATILYTEDESQDFFEVKVGDNNEFRFQTYYRFVIDHSSSDIYAVWDDEQLFPLDEWNKINNIAKEYSNKEDSLKYINYLSEHYKNIPDVLKDQIVRPGDLCNLETENNSSLMYIELPFDFKNYFDWQLRVDMGETDDGTFPGNYLEDNKSFQEEFINYFGTDTIPNSYYIFKNKKLFNTILMVCSVRNKPSLFYKIITLKNNQIINQFTIYNHKIGKLSDNFKITEDLHITKYTSGNIESEYQIEEDGKILKIK